MSKRISSFAKDLAAGKQGEKAVADALRIARCATNVDFTNAGKDHDFILEFEHFPPLAVETKTDYFSRRTSNIFIEVSCNNKNSGLRATKAALWVFYLPHLQEGLAFCPLKMSKYLASVKGARNRVVSGGDGGRARGHLVPIDAVKALPFVEIISIK